MSAEFYKSYVSSFADVLKEFDWNIIDDFYVALRSLKENRKTIYLCANGGSASNANHVANDFITAGVRAISLCASTVVLTCKANDHGYENCFSEQLKALADPGDILLVMSGSGNSQNIINALEVAMELQVETWGIIGYDGGKAKQVLDHCIHYPEFDMQRSEDFQTMVGHMLMQRLLDNK